MPNYSWFLTSPTTSTGTMLGHFMARTGHLEAPGSSSSSLPGCTAPGPCAQTAPISLTWERPGDPKPSPSQGMEVELMKHSGISGWFWGIQGIRFAHLTDDFYDFWTSKSEPRAILHRHRWILPFGILGQQGKTSKSATLKPPSFSQIKRKSR